MRRNRVLWLLLTCITVPILIQIVAGSGRDWLVPHRLLASGNGEEESWIYFPLAQKQASEAVLVGAGDIADCNRPYDEATADLLDGIEGVVFTTGDNAYPSGTPEQFRQCYEPSWGRHKARTRPSAGNHDYDTEGAAGYFDYFGAAAGDPQIGYYSYDLGQWHIVVLNSNCGDVAGGCDAGSPQEEWLRQDLEDNPRRCTLAYFHHPRFRSTGPGRDNTVLDLWWVLYDHDVDVVLNGHDHNYARFAPQDPEGNADSENGIRQFIVGTGGRNLRPVADSIENGEVLSDESHGVLKLVLQSTSYKWEFIPIVGETFTDAGSDKCH